MKDAGILNGDIAVLDASRDALDGSISAVLIDDEATLKRVYRKPEGLVLKAENTDFRDIKISPAEAEQTRIVGVLVGVVRKV